MAERPALDPQYVAARRVLLNALATLAPHGKAVILVGAQAVYLRTGHSDLAIAPFTTDGDLALDPTLLGDEPHLAESMHAAGFDLQLASGGAPEPGIWIATERISGADVAIPIDLIVPEAASSGEGRRGARLGIHGDRAARRAVGLEATLVDHSPMTITSLDSVDDREIVVEVAGVAALLVAKAHKIRDRTASGRTDRLADKDAADIYRIMQTARSTDVAATLTLLSRHAVAGPVTLDALIYLRELFGRRSDAGIAMAQRALHGAIADEEIETLCVTFTDRILP